MYGELIALGGTADIYDLGDGTVFKRFHDDKPDGCIDNEVECTQSEVAIRFGAPKIYEQVDDERGRGIIMEYVKGKSMLDVMRKGLADFDIETNARKLASLHYQINNYDGSMFPKGHELMRQRISWSHCLEEKTKQKLYQLLDSLPQGNCVCHTDIHPGNAMITDDGIRIIDWCDTICDARWLDLGRSLLIFESKTNLPGFELNEINRFRVAWRETYRAAYEKLSGTSEEELEGWMAILSAIKIDGEAAVNQEWMRERIEQAIRKF